MATVIGGSSQLWLALLLICPGVMLTAIQKSVVSLNPPWIRIFTGENVTLTCHGDNPLQNYSTTKWIHNGTNSKVTTSQLDIMKATVRDSGSYVCQNQGIRESNPVYLQVVSDWLLLQTSSDVVLEGESFLIRCHGWNNWNVYKVTYYKDDLALKFCYDNFFYSIRNATLNDSGTYHCTGSLKRLPYTSEKLRITVIKAHTSKYGWLQFIFPLLVAILFAVDTGLLLSTQKQFKLVLKIQKAGKGNEVET